MTKSSLILLAALVSGLTAHAGSISFDTRADLLSNDYDNASASADNTQFKLDTVRLDSKGKLNDSVSYRLRLRFNKETASLGGTPVSSVKTISQRDGTGAGLDLAFVTNKFNDSMALTVGKFATDMGGYEGSVSGADLYMKTIGFSGSRGIGDLYYTGTKFAYSFLDQEVALHVANQTVDASGLGNTGVAGKFNQNKFMTGLVYKGTFMDKALTAIASYHTQEGKITGPGTDDPQYKNTYMSVGAKYETDMFAVDGDYSMNTLGGYTVGYTTAQAAKNDTLNTMQVGFAYKMDQWTPRLKVESTTETVASASTTDTKTTYTGTQLAVEYKPVKDDMFRYHFAYWQREAKDDTAGAVAKTDKYIVLGTRIMADFLK